MSDSVTDPNINRDEHDDTGGIKAKRTKNFVWNPNTLTWDKQTASSGGGGGAVTIADGADVAEGATTDTAVITDTTGTVSGKLRGLVKWAFERMPASLGQKSRANSLPTTLSTEDVTALTPPAAITGFATETTLASIKDTSGIKKITDPLPTGTNTIGKVDQGAAGATGWPVKDDMNNFEAQKVTLVGSTDTTITFAQQVRLVRIKNFDTANQVLVKNSAIASNTDTASDYVGVAPVASVPSTDYFPYVTTTFHVRSAGASVLSITGFF